MKRKGKENEGIENQRSMSFGLVFSRDLHIDVICSNASHKFYKELDSDVQF